MRTDDFLFEIGTEELPPKQLKLLQDTLAEQIRQGLGKAGLSFGDIVAFGTPRRLAVLVKALQETQPEQSIERRGPSVESAFDQAGKPTKAAIGFARSCGLDDPAKLPRLETEKGSWLVFRESKPGAHVSEIMPSIIRDGLRALPIERSMRWGAGRAQFVRPVHWMVSLYGTEILPFEQFGLHAGRVTKGHRFMSRGDATINHAAEYEQVLARESVVASFDKRLSQIESELLAIGTEKKAKVVIDPRLLEEVTSLVEWPVCLCGHFDRSFLSVPEEALISAMKSHQRYFHLIDDDGHLLPMFITVANIKSSNPETVVAGNERVIAPRLSDAAFFYEKDSRSGMATRLESLKDVLFQSKLGTYFDKAIRVSNLAGHIASELGEDEQAASRAGLLCKADLVSDMVGEFPELQGVMGEYYARNDGEAESVAVAIGEHYQPTQSGGALPKTPVGQCVAIADKLDTLTGLFGIGEPPTGSRDPFALRRQALGVIRICIERGLCLDLEACITYAASLHGDRFEPGPLADYMLERLGGLYQEQGIGIDTFNAVRYSASPPRILVEMDLRVRAVSSFRHHPNAESLVAANKRVANLLKRSVLDTLPGVDEMRFQQDAERTLYGALQRTRQALLTTEDYQEQLHALAELQPVIDGYFDDVLVMDENPALRNNRLACLAEMRRLFLTVADVSLLQL